MKKLVTLFVVVAGLGLSSFNHCPQTNTEKGTKVFTSYGNIVVTVCKSGKYTMRIDHVSGTVPTTCDIICDGIDSGNNVTPGNHFSVPQTVTTVTLKWTNGSVYELYAGISNPVCP